MQTAAGNQITGSPLRPTLVNAIGLGSARNLSPTSNGIVDDTPSVEFLHCIGAITNNTNLSITTIETTFCIFEALQI
jgi:hypothetical protein